MLEHSHFSELLNQGYTIIRNSIDKNQVNEWKNLWKDIEKQSLLHNFGIKKTSESIIADVLQDENKKAYVWKTQNVLKSLDKGKILIKQLEDEFKTIHPNIRFLKDRFMNQRTNYQGHLPHQDLGSGSHSTISNEWYTVYTSLSDTDENSGCLWVEDIQPKRTESLKFCDSGCANGKTCLCTTGKVMPYDIKMYRGHKMIPIDLKEGDTVVFDGWVLHGTAANLSENTRQTLMFTFGKLRDEDLDIPDVFTHYNSKFNSKFESITVD